MLDRPCDQRTTRIPADVARLLSEPHADGALGLIAPNAESGGIAGHDVGDQGLDLRDAVNRCAVDRQNDVLIVESSFRLMINQEIR